MNNFYTYNKKTLQFEKIKYYKLGLYSILLICLSFCFSFTSALKVNNFVEKIPVIIRPNQEVLNEKNLRNEIKKLHLKYEDVIVAQYIIESGSGTSNIYKQNNNFLGLKEPHSRPTTSLGTNLSHSIFENWQNCLIDYSLWQTMCARGINSQEEYIQLLGSIYAEDQSYMDKINKILSK